jgi:hypothetical protein
MIPNPRTDTVMDDFEKETIPTLDDIKGVIKSKYYKMDVSKSLFRQGYNEAIDDILSALEKGI